MMEVASLGLAIKSDQVDGATASLVALTRAATTTESATTKLVSSTNAAGSSSEQFTARTKRIIEQQQFLTQQLQRSAAEQERYNALKRAGVAAESAAGAAVTESTRKLQQQRQAQEAATAAAMKASQVAKDAQQAAKASGLAALRPDQKLNLGYQINDIFTQLAGGANPALIAAQQGPQITQIFGGLKNTIAAIPTPAIVAIGVAIAGIAGVATLNAIAKLNDELAEQQRRLTTLLGSQTEAARAYGDIARFASDAGIGMDAATASFVAFGKASQGLGASRQNIADIASVSEKLTQLSGASKEDGSAAQGALANILKDTTVNADQLKTVLGTVPQIADRIASGLGVSVTQLRLMAAAGELSNRQVFDALLKQSAAVNAEFAKMPKSIGSTFQSLSDDLGQVLARFANLIPLVNDYRVAIDLAARAAKALNESTTPATPQQRLDTTASRVNSADRLRTGNVLLGSNKYAQDFTSAQFDQGVADNQATFAAIAAQSKAANENVVNGAALADKLDPLSKALRDSRKDIDDMEKALADLQGGLTGLSTAEAANQMGVLENAINRAKLAAANIDPALKALGDINQRNNARSNGGTQADIDVQTRTQALVTSGSNPQDAQTAALAEQQEKIADIIKAKQLEAEAEEKITAATGKGKAALIEAQVEAAKLAFIMANVGKNTEVSADAIKAFGDATRTVLHQQQAQANIDASKPLIAQLAGIAAAYDQVKNGAYAAKKAQVEAEAAHNENGTGALQIEVFRTSQLLADQQTYVALELQIDLTKKLAAAAGDVVKQKKIQLDYDVMQAKRSASPEAGPEIEKKMRENAAADSGKAYAEIIAQSKEFVTQQGVEQDAVFLGVEAAARLRFEYQLLLQAKQAGVELTPAVVAGLKDEAAAMAAAQAKTQRLTDLVNLGKSTVTGFLTDMRNGLQQGQSVWDSFGNAALNALNKISDKLIEMAVSDVFDAAFGGAKGAAGGGAGGLVGGLLGLLGIGGGAAASSAGGMASAGLAGSSFLGPANPFFGPGFANGGAFDRGNVIPFARGGIVSGPTLFPMANGMGLMGEAGPEAVMPLQRGPGGRLGVAVHGGGGGSTPAPAAPQVLQIHLMSDMLDAKIASGANVQIVKASPSIQGRAVKQSTRLAPAAVARQSAEREGEWRTRGAG